jgi:hypothetical protein
MKEECGERGKQGTAVGRQAGQADGTDVYTGCQLGLLPIEIYLSIYMCGPAFAGKNTREAGHHKAAEHRAQKRCLSLPPPIH